MFRSRFISALYLVPLLLTWADIAYATAEFDPDGDSTFFQAWIKGDLGVPFSVVAGLVSLSLVVIMISSFFEAAETEQIPVPGEPAPLLGADLIRTHRSVDPSIDVLESIDSTLLRVEAGMQREQLRSAVAKSRDESVLWWPSSD